MTATTFETDRIEKVPSDPAVYAMYAGKPTYVAYVGIAERVKGRLVQHFIRRDSSAVTGAGAVSLNPDLVRQVEWWTHDLFYETAPPNKVNRTALQAAELILARRLDPVPRSRGTVPAAAVALSQESAFLNKVTLLFDSPPSGRLHLRPMIERIEDLERQVEELRRELGPR